MISAEIIKYEEIKRREYPYLGIGKTSSRIVLFYRENSGILLKDSNPSFYGTRIGGYVTDWIEATFDIFTGKLLLKNGGLNE